MLTGLRSHSMGKRARAKRTGRWLQESRSGTRMEYADIDLDEAFVCGAQVLAFHPRTSDPLAFVWPDGRLSFNSTYFSHSDARELVAEVAALATRP